MKRMVLAMFVSGSLFFASFASAANYSGAYQGTGHSQIEPGQQIDAWGGLTRYAAGRVGWQGLELALGKSMANG